MIFLLKSQFDNDFFRELMRFFSAKGKTYMAYIYSDDSSVETLAKEGIERREVTDPSKFDSNLGKQEGIVILIFSRKKH